MAHTQKKKPKSIMMWQKVKSQEWQVDLLSDSWNKPQIIPD